MADLPVLLSNPNVALSIVFFGILMIYVECNRPGRVVPGCVGLLLVLCGAYGVSRFPIQRVGILLLLLGLGALMGGIFLAARVGWGVVAAGLLSVGLYRLIQPFGSAHVHPATAIVIGAGFSAVTLWLAGIALTARRNKRVLGVAGGLIRGLPGLKIEIWGTGHPES